MEGGKQVTFIYPHDKYKMSGFQQKYFKIDRALFTHLC